MMKANAVLEPPSDFGSIWAGEFEALEGAANCVFLFPRADVDAGEVLRALSGFELGEMNHVNRALAFADQTFQGLGQ